MSRPRTPRLAATLAMLAVAGMTLSAARARTRLPTRPSFDGPQRRSSAETWWGRTTVQGTLQYADSYTLKSAFDGVVTALPTPGTTLTQGSHVYTVAGNNTYLLHGATPAWRTFEEGMSDGEDVTQLESALSELGYFEATPNAHFDWNTIAAIKRWQKALTLPQNGTLPLGTVLLRPRRHAYRRAQVPRGRHGDHRDGALYGLVLASDHHREP